MVDGYEGLLTREEGEHVELQLWWKTYSRIEGSLAFSLVHHDALNDAAVALDISSDKNRHQYYNLEGRGDFVHRDIGVGHWGHSNEVLWAVERPRILADDDQWGGHWTLDIQLPEGPEGVVGVEVPEEDVGLVDEQSAADEADPQLQAWNAL